MPRFIVGRMERHCQPVTIVAADAEDAIDRVARGEGHYEESQMEYVEALDNDTWTVEKVLEVDWDAPLMVCLFHGRKHPDEDLPDWGFDGPIFLVHQVHNTYATTIRLSFDDEGDEIGELLYFEDLVYYDGSFYGDWTILSSKEVDDNDRQRAAVFIEEKAKIPKKFIDRKRPAKKPEGGRKLRIPQ